MQLFRALLVVFNVAVITFLIYRMVKVAGQPMERSKKIMIIIGGLMLLLAPLGIFFKFFVPTWQYFIIYPVAIGLYLYLTRQL